MKKDPVTDYLKWTALYEKLQPEQTPSRIAADKRAAELARQEMKNFRS